MGAGSLRLAQHPGSREGWILNLCLQTFKIPTTGCKSPHPPPQQSCQEEQLVYMGLWGGGQQGGPAKVNTHTSLPFKGKDVESK